MMWYPLCTAMVWTMYAHKASRESRWLSIAAITTATVQRGAEGWRRRRRRHHHNQHVRICAYIFWRYTRSTHISLGSTCSLFIDEWQQSWCYKYNNTTTTMTTRRRKEKTKRTASCETDFTSLVVLTFPFSSSSPAIIIIIIPFSKAQGSSIPRRWWRW